MKKNRLLLTICLFALIMVLLIPVYAAPKVKLTLWGRDLTDNDPAHAYIKALVNGFKAKNPDIELEYVAQGDPGLMDKTKVVMAAGSGLPDIFQSWGGSTMGGYANAGRLLDLTKELKGIPGSAAAQDAMTWKGKIYGVAPFFAIAGLFYNEGIFKANNLIVPTTVADLEKVADALKARGIQPFACGARDKWPPLHMYMYLVDRFGGISAFGNAQSRKGAFSADPFVKAAQKTQEWVKKGYFGEKPLSEAYGDAQQLVATGKAAMHITGTWMCAQYADPGFTDQNIGFAAFPEMAGGKGKISDMMGMPDIGFVATKVAAGKKAAVVKFMKYAMSVEACSAEKGRLCSVPGVKAPTRLTEMAAGVFGKAKAVQFWWDQDLPPALGGPTNDTVGKFFLAETDVAKALADFEKMVVDSMGPVKK